MKKLLTTILAIMMFICISPIKLNAQENLKQSSKHFRKPIVIKRALPGRPGGNGDGSEEWLRGRYGEMNGPYKLISTSTGTVADLNQSARNVSTVLWFLIGIGLHGISGGLSTILGGISSGVEAFDKGYEGIYYKSWYYVSGRRSKLVIYTYSDVNLKNLHKTYTIYNKW
ncbi:MAG: hypothetical protein SPI53_00720 [Erysipelotrichaceae bacterium]|nr:hypothetical protein [Erysipelotrichaceae bacterium]